MNGKTVIPRAIHQVSDIMEQAYKDKYNQSAAVSITDLLLVIWILYCVIRNFWAGSDFGNLYPYLFIFSCYILVRSLRLRPSGLFKAIIVIGIGQSILAFLQSTGWLASNHGLFEVTGSFKNPGQLGGFLATSTICTLCIGLQGRKMSRLGFIPLLLIQGYALILSDSLAAWIAAICGSLFLVWHYSGTLRRKIKSSRRLKIMFCLLFAAILLGLYLYKPRSANGRLLVWRVTADMITAKPVFGHGIGKFGGEYMYYQAAYFEAHNDSPYRQYADNIAYPYNEFLHIWAEQGIIGLLLLSGLVVGALCTPAMNSTYKGALVAYLSFAQFSYPSHVPGLLALFPVLLAAIRNRPLSVHIPKGISWALLAMAICCAGYVGKEYAFRLQCRATMQRLFSSSESNIADAEAFVARHYRHLLSCSRIADVYAQYVCEKYEPQEALTVLNEVRMVAPTAELYCDLGDLYKALGDFGSAQDCYRIAGNMIPRRLTPKYKLFVLFQDMGETDSAKRQAEEILAMPLHIEGTRTLKMKAEVLRYLTAFQKNSPRRMPEAVE